jgi:hypothetical protein
MLGSSEKIIREDTLLSFDVTDALDRAIAERLVTRIAERDASVWSTDPIGP